MSRAAGYSELVERFGAERVADAVLAKWLNDDAGAEGWRRLAAMVTLHDAGARLSHLYGIDADWFRASTFDGYVPPPGGQSGRDAALAREARKRETEERTAA